MGKSQFYFFLGCDGRLGIHPRARLLPHGREGAKDLQGLLRQQSDANFPFKKAFLGKSIFMPEMRKVQGRAQLVEMQGADEDRHQRVEFIFEAVLPCRS